MKKTTLLLILLTAVCVNAEWTFDNDKDVQERGDKRDEEREEARKALERVRFGVKVGAGIGAEISGESTTGPSAELGVMINAPLSRIKNGNLLLATELNYCFRTMYEMEPDDYRETYLNIPLMFQYVSFFFPTSDIQVHWVPSPKRHFFMHLKTIMEAGAFIDIPLDETGSSFDEIYNHKRNSYDIGGIVGYAFQLESITFGVRITASYVNFGGSALLGQIKTYFGYLF